jgi:hypothetical protein
MALSPAQLATLKADILANGDLNANPNTSDGNVAVAALYNAPASPAWTAWKTNVPIGDVGKNINGAELAGLSSLNNTRIQTLCIMLAGGVNPSLSDQRFFWDDIFSGASGTVTRPQLLALWKRTASRVQKLFSTGTGSNAVPATLALNIPDGFLISASEVETARNLP